MAIAYTLCLWISFTSAFSQNVNYAYDELGQLVGVVDQNGNAAQYTYDAVGNILSITRFSSTQVAILAFTPSSGPVGTQVIISGSNFSSTAAQDTVLFNGAVATITSATTTKLIATVPSGATTGPITVTSPIGSSTSTRNFSVVASSQPTITSFTPQNATPGTTITVVGTNFDPKPANDRVSVNTSITYAGSAAASQLIIPVPSNTGSGRISIATPYGQAVSSQDLYIPFGAHVAADIGFGARISMGQAQSLSLSANKIGLVLFDASAGQSASLQLSSSTFSSCTIYIFGPTGAQLTSSSCLSSVGFVPSVTLPSSGTYAVGIDPGTSSGSMTVGVTADLAQSINPNGATSQISLVAGERARLTFSGTPGQLATVQATQNTASFIQVALLDPSGSTLISSLPSGPFVLPAKILSSTGTYTILIGPAQQSGNLTMALTVSPAATNPPSRSNGSVVDPSSLLSAHLVGLFVMNEGSGNSTQNLVDANAATFTGTSLPTWTSDPAVSIGGGASLNSYLNAGTDLAFDQLPISKVTVLAKVYVSTLAAGGIAEKNDSNTNDSGFVFGFDNNGALGLTVESRVTDMKVKTTTAAITQGQWIQVAFTWDGTSGTALGSNAHLFINGIEQPKAFSSDGTGNLGYASATNQPFRIGNASFDFTGSLNGKIAYLAVYRGRILTPAELSQFDSQVPTDTSDTHQAITPNASPTSITTTTAGQRIQLTFNATVGQLASVQFSNNTIGSVTATLLNPDLTILSSTTSSATSFSLPTQWLSYSGEYRIYVQPTANTSGNITVGLTLANIPSRPAGSIGDPGNALGTNLVGLFLMNEGSGTTDQNVADAQSALFSGSILPTWNTTDPSILFSGGASLNSYLNAGTDLAFDQLPTSKMTVVAEVYVSSLAAAGIAEKNDGNTIDSGFEFGWNASGALTLEVESSSGNMKAATGSGVITAGQWIQVAFTWDGTGASALASNAHLFVNGVEVSKATNLNGSGTLGYANATYKPFRIGNASFDTIAGSLNGKLAYLAVYKGRILSTSEMTLLGAQLPIPVNSTDLVKSISPSTSPVGITTTTPAQRARVLFCGGLGQQAAIQLTNNSIGSVTVSLLKPDNTTVLNTVTSSSTSFTFPTTWLPASGVYTVSIQPTGNTNGNISVSLTLANTPARPTGSAVDTNNSLATSLVGLFLMNEGTGSVDQDIIDSQNATFSGTSLPTWNTSDPSIVFNGGSSLASYLNAGTDLTFDQLPTSKVTLVAKIYVNTVASSGIAEKNDGNTINSGFEFGFTSSGALTLDVESSSANMRTATMNGVIQAGQWMQVAFTWDGTGGSALASNAHLFINGVEVSKATSINGSGTLGYTNATNKPFRIGNASYDSIPGALNGKIAYLAVYRGRILTAAEMNQLDAQLPIH